MRIWLLIITLFFVHYCGSAAEMTQEKMESYIKKAAFQAAGRKGFLRFQFQETIMFAISDIRHDRMRIISPIIEYGKITEEQKDAVLESNFHRALDARYASSNGILYAAYIHPLSNLTQKQLQSALEQVALLAATFGKEYTSGKLTFEDKQ